MAPSGSACSVTVSSAEWLECHDGALTARLEQFAAVAAELIMTKTMYGDTLVRLRRRSAMGLAAEMQWSLLPPLTFASTEITIAAGLEPAYEVAGDSIDYAVDGDVARMAIFDGMGHGLQSAQMTALAVGAYRNARRSGLPLAATVDFVEDAVATIYSGDAFITAQMAELDVPTGSLTWLNAGHPDPLLIRGGRLVHELHTHHARRWGSARSSLPPCLPRWVGRRWSPVTWWSSTPTASRRGAHPTASSSAPTASSTSWCATSRPGCPHRRPPAGSSGHCSTTSRRVSPTTRACSSSTTDRPTRATCSPDAARPTRLGAWVAPGHGSPRKYSRGLWWGRAPAASQVVTARGSRRSISSSTWPRSSMSRERSTADGVRLSAQ